MGEFGDTVRFYIYPTGHGYIHFDFGEKRFKFKTPAQACAIFATEVDRMCQKMEIKQRRSKKVSQGC